MASFEICYYQRCCFCLPLRRGLLTLGYIHLLFGTLMVGLISYFMHIGDPTTLVIEGVGISEKDREVCIAGYCIQVVVTVVMLYGAHKKTKRHLIVFCYYTMCTVIAGGLLELYVNLITSKKLGLLPLFYIGMCVQIYLAFLIRNLLKQLKMSRDTDENQLNQIGNGRIVQEVPAETV